MLYYIEDATPEQLFCLKENGSIFVAGTEKNPVDLDAGSFLLKPTVAVTAMSLASTTTNGTNVDDDDDVEFVPDSLLSSNTATDVFAEQKSTLPNSVAMFEIENSARFKLLYTKPFLHNYIELDIAGIKRRLNCFH